MFLSSPNNPVGNVIAVSDLEKLLSGHPQSLFVMDEVYADFAESNFLSLLGRFNNLVLLRSFSKTMSAAGVRLGYLLGSAEVCRQVRKLLLSFSLNHFTNVFATIVLQDAHLIGLFKSQVAHVIAERERLRYCFERDMGEWLRVWPSQGNFLLVTLRDSETFYHIINGLMNNGIGVLDVSGMPLLMNSFRMSVGVDYENNKVLRLLHDLVTN
ncbi:aminotransferase class I/II-fold pyridoxal phosphate-dependent enzyme [Breznakibacter xylanolyticus]|uniref:aminotransferase class I/II-fold pyridoxal phosphate-dependent enzyme n=1 Tax=Breznakibacter xylanolyticus TaxID=990 RepID=UPI000DAC5CE7|nr:aminotransferase class I/II-fold pyridoxal phosphate-dependent enzyme [Breznakibacter xylanolyticus]